MAPTDAAVAVPGSGRVALATMRLDALVAAPYNPRTITEPALGGLSKSVRRFGLVQPVIWNKRTGHVVGGHQRLKALAAQGVAETDVVVVDLPELEEKALNLALNSPAISGQFTADAIDLIDEVAASMAPLADALLFGELRDTIEDLCSGPKQTAQEAEKWLEESPSFCRGDPARRWSMAGNETGGGSEVTDGGAERAPGATSPGEAPAVSTRPTGRRTVPAAAVGRRALTAPERVLLLDAWMRSRLPASEFASLVGLSAATLYQWKKRFEARGPAGLEDGPRGRKGGSRLAEPIRRAIVMLKRAHPDWGQDRIHDVLLRSEGYGASPGAVALVLEEEGYVVEEVPTVPHEAPVRRFERARPNELWQTDLFTFLLKRENRRVHLVAFMDSCGATGYVESSAPAPADPGV